MRHRPGGAIVVEQPTAFDAESGFERAGRVVDAGMDHAGVVAACFHAAADVAFQHTDRPVGGGKGARHGQSDEPTPDHGDIYRQHADIILRNP